MTAVDDHIGEVHSGELHEHVHPSDKQYLIVGAVLFVLTGLEVATYAFGMKGTILLVTLFPLMILKFGIVVAYFMHLKFDSKLFRKFFVTGIILAVTVYMIVLTTLHVFD